jgi:short-subunit dehydrogenase
VPITVLITGATAGIGAAFVRRYAADGATLIVVARDAERLERTADQLRRQHGTAVEVLPADLSTEAGIAAVEERLAKGGVDILVNNAGFGHKGRFLQVGVEAELEMLRVHCEAVLRLTYAALPGMVEQRHGGVINVASVAAFLTRGTYSASKAWVVTFSESIAQDLGAPGVHVMALCPGWVRTEFHERARMDTSGVPGFMWLDADRLVAAAVRDFGKGRAVSIPGVQYRILLTAARLIPRPLVKRLSTGPGRRYRDEPDNPH